MTTIEEMKAALADYDRALANMNKLSTPASRAEWHEVMGRHRLDHLTFTDWLRALLPVVEAAQALAVKRDALTRETLCETGVAYCHICTEEAEEGDKIIHADDCELGIFLKAVSDFDNLANAP